MISRRLLILAAITAFTLLTLHQLAFSGLILARGDTYSYFYPYWAARDAALARGQLPLWTPDIFMGAPLLADPQIGTFYPPNWPAAFLGWEPPEAVKISILLHVIWGAFGAYGLARFAGRLDTVPALISALIFGLGGFVGAHVEQINQLQGLAWMPWAFLTYHQGFEKPLRYAPLLAMTLALQVFSGHTQTAFITGFGLALYGFSTVILDIRSVAFPAPDDWRRVLALRIARVTLVLVAAVILAALLALPQILPTLELTGQSNRGSGFNPQQAMAFSWEPALVGRGLLPSYDAQIFGEYVAYVGVVGLALALLGAFSDARRRAPWVIVALMGIFLALGLYNPLYWQAASLPGFNLFRVPARWLALFTLGAAVLAGMGAQALVESSKRPRARGLFGVGVILGALAGASLLARQADAALIDGPAVPGLLTWAAWGLAFVAILNLALLRPYLRRALVAGLLLLFVSVELFFASRVMPYNDLVTRDAYADLRLTAHQLSAYADDCAASDGVCPLGRVLSISGGFFDPGDKAGLEARYAAAGLTERAVRYGLTSAKLRELLAPNLSLLWGIPTVDGFGGGLVPTTHYTAFSALLLPDGAPRTLDGRLRELLARPECGGACPPEARWLDLIDARYLIADKTYDPWIDGVAYDALHALTLSSGESALIADPPAFTATEARAIYVGDSPPIAVIDGLALALTDDAPLDPALAQNHLSGARLAVYALDAPAQPDQLALRAVDTTDAPTTIHALTLVDARTGDFAQATLGAWRWRLSSDIKLYENQSPHVGRARFIARDGAAYVTDDWVGTEAALALMDDPAFDPAQQIVIALPPDTPSDALDESERGRGAPGGEPHAGGVTFAAYNAERAELRVTAPADGYLLLADAHDPGWVATVNGENRPVYRANVLFRAVEVTAGESVVVFEYAPAWLRWLPLLGIVLWAMLVAVTAAIWNQRVAALEAPMR